MGKEATLNTLAEFISANKSVLDKDTLAKLRAERIALSHEVYGNKGPCGIEPVRHEKYRESGSADFE